MQGLLDGLLGNHAQDMTPEQHQQLQGYQQHLNQNAGYYQQNPDQMQGVFNGILGAAAPFILNYGINAILNRGQQGGQGGYMPSSGYAPTGGYGGYQGQSPLGGLISGALPGIISGLSGQQSGGLGGILGGTQGGGLGGILGGLAGGNQQPNVGGQQGGFGEQPPLRSPGETSL